MLTMLNKGPVSEGLREEDVTGDSPEDHDLPPLSWDQGESRLAVIVFWLCPHCYYCCCYDLTHKAVHLSFGLTVWAFDEYVHKLMIVICD